MYGVGVFGLGEARTGALEVSEARTATPGRGQNVQFHWIDLRVFGVEVGPPL